MRCASSALRRVCRRARQILGRFVVAIAGLDAKLVDAGPFLGGARSGRDQPDALATSAIVPFGVCR